MPDIRNSLDALVGALPIDAHSVLGRHDHPNGTSITMLAPGATGVVVCDRAGKDLAQMASIHRDGVFHVLSDKLRSVRDYQFRVDADGKWTMLEDTYRFGSPLSDGDIWLFSEGRHQRAFDFLGAHVKTMDGVAGMHFVVWAPNARRVAVVGDFNHYDARTHVLRFHPGCGLWDLFVPGPGIGCHYRFDIIGADGIRREKIDPYAREFLTPSDTVAVVPDLDFNWGDDDWMAKRRSARPHHEPVSIYEVHAGSWRHPADGSPVSYRFLAACLLDYAVDMGFTHIEFLPLSEHPFTGSWGYQPTGMFAPTARYGDPTDFKYLVDAAHRRGIGIILDWVPAHFPGDDHGLARFDGTALYEHVDPLRGLHPDWGTLIYNYSRAEVVNFLVGSALYWLEEFHIDGIRVDAVASMLYLDYSRKSGEWLPNERGGRENLEAVALLQQVNSTIAAHFPGVLTIAEESTAWTGVSAGVDQGGLGFSFKWNMGWMHDTLAFMSRDPLYRSHHHNQITFSMMYAYSEQYVLPISHDEVVHGKRSLLGKMPGDDWQRFANLRVMLAYMWAHPGKKLLFMGCEIGEWREWNHDGELDWNLLGNAPNAGIKALVRDLNALLADQPVLYKADGLPEGFQWLVVNDAVNSVLAFERAAWGEQPVVVVINLTPVVRHDYLVPVSCGGIWREVMNTDSQFYGGTNVGNNGRIESVVGREGEVLRVQLPPLAAVFFLRDSP